MSSYIKRLDDPGLQALAIAKELRTTRVTVGRWRQRFAAERLAGLLWPEFPERAARANLRHTLTAFITHLCLDEFHRGNTGQSWNTRVDQAGMDVFDGPHVERVGGGAVDTVEQDLAVGGTLFGNPLQMAAIKAMPPASPTMVAQKTPMELYTSPR